MSSVFCFFWATIFNESEGVDTRSYQLLAPVLVLVGGNHGLLLLLLLLPTASRGFANQLNLHDFSVHTKQLPQFALGSVRRHVADENGAQICHAPQCGLWRDW